MASSTFTHTPQETRSDILRSEVRDVYQSGRGVDTLHPRSLIVLMTRPLPIPRPFRVHFLPDAQAKPHAKKNEAALRTGCVSVTHRATRTLLPWHSNTDSCVLAVVWTEWSFLFNFALTPSTVKREKDWVSSGRRPISGCVLRGEQRGGRRLTNRAFLKFRILKIDHLNTVYNKMVNGSFKTGAFRGDNVVFVPVVFLFW